MNISQMQEDALTEFANIGAARAAKHLSVLLHDKIKMTVPCLMYGAPGNLPQMLKASSQEVMVGVQQQLEGFFSAKITFLFCANDSAALAQELIGQNRLEEDTSVGMRALQYDAITEIGNIVMTAFINALIDSLDETLRLSLPNYVEGTFTDLLAASSSKNNKGDSSILLLKTNLEAERRNVLGALVLIISDADLEHLMHKIDLWLKKLGA